MLNDALFLLLSIREKELKTEKGVISQEKKAKEKELAKQAKLIKKSKEQELAKLQLEFDALQEQLKANEALLAAAQEIADSAQAKFDGWSNLPLSCPPIMYIYSFIHSQQKRIWRSKLGESKWPSWRKPQPRQQRSSKRRRRNC